ncbi:MAG: polysaccharide biosynthesis tyrosine autokinase [Desulfitobacteriaceae bacterium]|nr:polysaccharide biosynthesis tyrosine autokinase [Desulfitobacteriaceae bacterium]MDD4752270.1 polysaccharide biosynthesis tyrosine autokinase [Desulfitobacteriaceae bacterium]
MELTIFSWVIKKYKILIISITILAGLTGFIMSNLTNNVVYKASAVLMVTSNETDPNNIAPAKIDYTTILANKEALKTYSQIVQSTAVFNQVLNHLDSTISMDQLRNSVWAQQIGDTELMEIGAVHENPQYCVTITNALGNVFVDYVKNVLGINNIKLIAPAVQTGSPTQQNKLFYIVVAAFLGFTLSTFGSLIFDFILQPIRCANDIKHFSLPFFGKISAVKLHKNIKNFSYTKNVLQNNAAISGFFRLLLAAEQNLGSQKTLMVTSPIKGEGKSFISAGLAGSRTQTPGKTILIDANLSGPTQDKIFGLKNQLGISNLTETDTDQQHLFLKSSLPGLDIVTAGTLPVNSNTLFCSDNFNHLMTSAASQADLVIIDAPAILENTEALVLATKVESVLLIVQEGTSRVKVDEALQHLKSINANILGIVLNGYSKFPLK